MKIVGFQKLTMVDYPEKMACIIFTERCNYQCPYCHNSSLVYDKSDNYIEESEIFDYLNKRKGILEGIVISGGEPTLQKDLKQFLEKLRTMYILIKLDTNGSNPLLLKDLIDHNLVDYVAMDVKNSLKKYPITTAINNINTDNILKSIEILKNSQIDYEFRTTIVKELHDMEDIKEIKKLIGKSKYYLQNFKDSEGVKYSNLHGFTENELKEIEKEIKGVKIRGLIHKKNEEE